MGWIYLLVDKAGHLDSLTVRCSFWGKRKNTFLFATGLSNNQTFFHTLGLGSAHHTSQASLTECLHVCVPYSQETQGSGCKVVVPTLGSPPLDPQEFLD